MNWRFTNDRPIFAQIVELIQKGILLGEYPPGSPIPSVRTLALEAAVNPNTMQKALSELEKQGLLYTQRTSGRTVTEDEGLIMELKERIALGYIEQFFEGMQSLGIERDTAVTMLAANVNVPASQETASQETASQETASQETASQETASKETASQEPIEAEVQDRNTLIKEVN